MPPPPSFLLRLRTWLMLLSFVAMLPLLALSVSMLWTLKDKQQQDTLDALTQRSNDVSRAVASRLNLAISTLQALAASRAALGEDLQALHEQSRRVLRQHPQFRAIALVDAEGELRFLTSVAYGTPLRPAAYPEQVRQALDNLQPHVSGPFLSPVSPLRVVAVTVPLATEAGAPRYALRLILSTDSLNELLQEQGLPDGWVVGIADHQGTLVARNLTPERYVGQRASDSFVSAIQRFDTHIFRGSTLDGTHTTNLVLPIYGNDWFLGVGVPDALLDEPLWQMLWSTALLALSWLALSFMVGSAFAGYLVRQMRQVGLVAQTDVQALPPGPPLRVAELRAIALGLIQSRRQTAAARSDLSAMTSARDEVQDLYDRAPCGYHSLDREGRFVRINQTELNWLGHTREQVMGRSFLDFVAPHSVAGFRENFARFLQEGEIKDVELDLVRSTGSLMPVLISATALRDAAGELVMSRSTVFDNTEQKMMEAQLDRLARTDALTSLSNRRDFCERAEQELARSRRHGHALALLMLDVDHFKAVNDTHGHATGDEVLRQLSRELGEVLRESDVPARLGGEEFAVLLPDTEAEAACQVAERLRAHLANHPARLDSGQPLAYTVSMGVAFWHPSDTRLDELMQRADKALYDAKRGGRDRVVRAPDPA
jgi:diguanylate cyclase (GGDEF)-like protein/PAS domain S-box-containing protein